MLEPLGPDTELHVIDPLPEVRPEPSTPGASPAATSSTATSATTCCPTCLPCDVALIDGDHNWYTVYHELRMLRETARDAGVPMPLLILHDVCWPYGRRDLYYAPERIPEEFRQPYEHARASGPDSASCWTRAASTRSIATRCARAGPRNGVMTALDDFIAEHDRPLRRVVLPDLLRARDRRRGGAARRAPRACSACSTGSRARDGRTSCSSWPSRSGSRRSLFKHNDLLRRQNAERTGPLAATSTCSRAPCSTSTTSRTSCGSSTCWSASSAGEAPSAHEARRTQPAT